MKDDYRILLVDDDDDILWINQMILSDAGFSVDTSNDPEEALKKIKSEKFRIFVLDYMMPKIKGDELAQKIIDYYKAVRTVTVGIIFLTGYSEFASYMQKVGDMTNPVLLKPISERELIDVVQTKIDYLKGVIDCVRTNKIYE